MRQAIRPSDPWTLDELLHAALALAVEAWPWAAVLVLFWILTVVAQ